MKELSKERLEHLLTIMKQDSIQYFIDNNSYKMRLISEIQQACKQIKEMIHQQGIDENWLPTPEDIDALPEPVRKFIRDIETNIDPQGMVRENVLIKDTCKALVIKLEEKGKVDQAFVNIWADKYLSKGDICYLRKQAKLMLEEAGVEVVKK